MASAEDDIALLRKKKSFEIEVRSYNGPDPLKLYYEFISWMDAVYGKNNVVSHLVPLLEEVINNYLKVPKYAQDQRFIKLIILYADVKENSSSLYQYMHNMGVGTECAIFYKAWADELKKDCDYVGALKVYNMGLKTPAKPIETLRSYHYEFFIEITPEISQALTLLAENSKKEPQQVAPVAQPSGVKNWYFNSSPADDLEFNVPVAYFEPPDPSKVPMYPKDMVYRNNTEYSLEEIMALFYNKKTGSVNHLGNGDINSPLAKKPHLEQSTIAPLSHMDKSEDSSTFGNPSFKPVVPHLFKKANEQNFSMLNAQSFTVNTKEAMNVVQEMWSSPSTSRPSQSDIESEVFKVPEPPKTSFNIFNESSAVAVPPKPSSIQIFADSICEPKNKIDEDNIAPRMPTTGKRDSTRPLSERKVLAVIDDKNQPAEMHARQQLPFSLNQEKSQEDMLAEKLADTSLQEQIRPVTPVNLGHKEDDNFTDITCNTKAFDFVLPSSTPFGHSRRPQNYVPNNDGSYIAEEISAAPKTQPDLSMILEASKERYSSTTGNSSNSSQPCTSITHGSIKPANRSMFPTWIPFSPKNHSSFATLPSRESYRCSSLPYSPIEPRSSVIPSSSQENPQIAVILYSPAKNPTTCFHQASSVPNFPQEPIAVYSNFCSVNQPSNTDVTPMDVADTYQTSSGNPIGFEDQRKSYERCDIQSKHESEINKLKVYCARNKTFIRDENISTDATIKPLNKRPLRRTTIVKLPKGNQIDSKDTAGSTNMPMDCKLMLPTCVPQEEVISENTLNSPTSVPPFKFVTARKSSKKSSKSMTFSNNDNKSPSPSLVKEIRRMPSRACKMKLDENEAENKKRTRTKAKARSKCPKTMTSKGQQEFDKIEKTLSEQAAVETNYQIRTRSKAKAVINLPKTEPAPTTTKRTKKVKLEKEPPNTAPSPVANQTKTKTSAAKKEKDTKKDVTRKRVLTDKEKIHLHKEFVDVILSSVSSLCQPLVMKASKKDREKPK